MAEMKLQTLAILVDNEAGVLSQVCRLFSRKGYNIESIASGTTSVPGEVRITICVYADDEHAELLSNQVRKLVSVRSVKLLTNTRSTVRELTLIKVKAADYNTRSDIMQTAGIFRASVIDVSPDTLTIAMIGGTEKITAIEQLLAQHGILEVASTGLAALERGSSTIYENTKEMGEFNIGKNVL